MNSILEIYHRPTVSREYKTADDFAAQVVGSEDLDEIDIVALETAAKEFWCGCRAAFPVEGQQ